MQTESQTISDRIGKWGNLMKLWELLKKDTSFAAEKIFQLIWHKRKPVDIQNENSDQKEKPLPLLSCCLFFFENYLFFPRKCGK